MPRIIMNVRARADASYQMDYHYPLRSRIYNALNGTEFDDRHDSPQPPGFATSSIIPFGDLEEGDIRTLIISAPERDLLKHVIDDFGSNRELNLGEVPLEVDSAWIKDIDVGGPGSSGMLETVTGILVEIQPEEFEEYGIEDTVVDREQPEFWRPHIGSRAFDDAIRRNLEYKHELFGTGELYDGPLFESREFFKEFSKPLVVTRSPDVRQTVVLTKHYIDFTVQSQAHRRLLNLALDCGLGPKNHLGLGFLDLKPPRSPAQGT